MQTLTVGNVCLERYLVEKVLGSGANGTVYLAEDLQLKRRVAIKVLHQWTAQTPDNAAKRFEREAQALSKLMQANIIQIYRYGEFENSVPFIVMEYVEGEPLNALIARRRQLDVSESVVIAKQIATALEYAHRNGFVHRDLKPENVMVINQQTAHSDDASVLVKILDFGLSKTTSEQRATLTKTGMIVGTVLYMSPEQGMGEEVDKRSDIYSLGCILFEMVSGSPPFVEEAPAAVLLKHMNQPLPRLCAVSPESKLPTQLDDVISRCCQKNKENRYADCAELLEDLQALHKLKSKAVYIPEADLKNRRAKQNLLKLCVAFVLFFTVVAGAAMVVLLTDRGKIIFTVYAETVLDPNTSIACLVNLHKQFLDEGKVAQAVELASESTGTDSNFSYWPAVQKVRLLYRYAEDYEKRNLPKEAFRQALSFYSTAFALIRRQQLDTGAEIPTEEIDLLNDLSKRIYHEKHSKKEWQELSSLIELNSGAFPKSTPGYLLWPDALRVKSKVNSGKVFGDNDLTLISRVYSQAADIASAQDETDLMFELANAGVRFSRAHELFYDEHCQYCTICNYYLRKGELSKARLALAEVERIAKGLLLSNAEMGRLNRLRAQCGVGGIVPLPVEDPNRISLLQVLFSKDSNYVENEAASGSRGAEAAKSNPDSSDLKH